MTIPSYLRVMYELLNSIKGVQFLKRKQQPNQESLNPGDRVYWRAIVIGYSSHKTFLKQRLTLSSDL